MSDPTKKLGKVYLERALSKLGILSRSQARKAIMEGTVSIDGVVETDPYKLVAPEKIKVSIHGKPVATDNLPRVFLMNKPKQTVCTSSDEKGRRTVFEFFKEHGGHYHSVGRLDWATTGLLLITNDSKISNYLTDPKNQIPRTYHVTVRGELEEPHMEVLKSGIESDGELLVAQNAVLRKTSKKESHAFITLTEGKNRELRRMFETLRHEVTALKRISFGPLTLPDIPPGNYQEISLAQLIECFPNIPTRNTKTP